MWAYRGLGTMMNSDVFRAMGAVLVSAGLGVGLVQAAPELRKAGLLPEAATAISSSVPPRELVYAIINMTEEMDARTACPLDMDIARLRVETGLQSHAVKPVYSPVAEGPDVLTHEISAQLDTAGTRCLWTAVTLYAGTQNQPHHDLPNIAYSSLEAASRNIYFPDQTHAY